MFTFNLVRSYDHVRKRSSIRNNEYRIAITSLARGAGYAATKLRHATVEVGHLHGADSVDSPAAAGNDPDAVQPPLLGVLGVVELELAPDELPPDELEPQPEPEPVPVDDSSSPDPDPDPKGGQGGLATRARGALLVARPRTAT